MIDSSNFTRFGLFYINTALLQFSRLSALITGNKWRFLISSFDESLVRPINSVKTVTILILHCFDDIIFVKIDLLVHIEISNLSASTVYSNIFTSSIDQEGIKSSEEEMQ